MMVGEVTEGTAGGTGPALEQGVAGEQRFEVGRVEADRSGRMTRRVQDMHRLAADRQHLAVVQFAVRSARPFLLPERLVRRGAAGSALR